MMVQSKRLQSLNTKVGLKHRNMYTLPIDYTKLHWTERRTVREQYIKEQDNKCFYCKESLTAPVPKRISDKKINWNLFPPNFLKYPIHLKFKT